MNIALDFDKTYTLDPVAWDKFCSDFRAAGHCIYCVTMRHDHPNEAAEVKAALSGKIDGFFFTARQAKVPYMAEKYPAMKIHVWIDDSPYWLLNGG